MNQNDPLSKVNTQHSGVVIEGERSLNTESVWGFIRLNEVRSGLGMLGKKV